VIEAGGARIGLVHNGGPRAGREARLSARFPSCSAVVYGHSHIPQVSRHGEVLTLNPGSPTDRRRASEHTMIELEIEDGEFRPELITL
jgi:putative phosphoesterase